MAGLKAASLQLKKQAMSKSFHLNIGLSDNAISAYLSLIGNHPVNGSQLSRQSGIPRTRIYDILRALKKRGFVSEISPGMYIPLPPAELINQLRQQHESDLKALETLVEETRRQVDYEFIWTIKGYDRVLSKAREMIESARSEIYIRLFPEEGGRLDPHLKGAEKRGASVKYVSMRPAPFLEHYRLHVVHPGSDTIETVLGGRTFDIVVDRQEVMGGMFESGREDHSPITWGRNPWFISAQRDSLRHDFFHYFLHKTYQLKESLTAEEQTLYETIMNDV